MLDDESATTLVTADVATNSFGMDSGYFQSGLPALMDADEDGQITWTEWKTAYINAADIAVDFMNHVRVFPSLTERVWEGSYEEFEIRDLDGDFKITFVEYWVSEQVFVAYYEMLEEGAEEVSIEDFSEASDEELALYNFDASDSVSFEEYIEVKAAVQGFKNVAVDGVVTRENLHEVGFIEAEFIIYDANADDSVSLAEYLTGIVAIKTAVQTGYNAYIASAVALDATYLDLTLTVWLAIGETDADFLWMDINLDGLIDEEEYEITYFELNEFNSYLETDEQYMLVATYFEKYPGLTQEWTTLFDAPNTDGDIDGFIYIDEWKAAMTVWH